VELADELVYGAREAAWPLIRHDLGLGYAEVALALALPSVVALLIEPLVGVLAERGLRRPVLLAGGAAFAASALAMALVPSFAALLAVQVVAFIASGAFVGLAQAALMDAAPAARERNMARWTLVGSVGVVCAPACVALAVTLGLGWRAVFAALGVAVAFVVVPATRSLPVGASEPAEDLRAAARTIVALLRRRELLRWLVVLAASDLMLDVLHAFLALYLVDVAGFSPAAAALGLAVLTGAGLVGDAALLLVLRRVPGLAYLRASAVVVACVYPAVLLAPGRVALLAALALVGLATAGWYAIPQARVYEVAGERSGAALAAGTLAGAAGAALPLGIGLVASAAGLGVALWIPLAAPAVLLALVPRRRPG
jgi:FSR family fosmidomycin resistance protein-like MFS transporter